MLCDMCIFYIFFVLPFIIDCKISFQAPKVIVFERCPFQVPAHVGERAKGKEGTAATFQIPTHSKLSALCNGCFSKKEKRKKSR